MLCGNKTDLRESYAEEGKTVIPTEKGEKLAKVRLYVNFLIWKYYSLSLFYLSSYMIIRLNCPVKQFSRADYKFR